MLATVASLTSANRIKRRALEKGIYALIIQTPQAISKEGCGYSLRFDDSQKEQILSVAAEMGIRIRALYTESTVGGEKQYTLKEV